MTNKAYNIAVKILDQYQEDEIHDMISESIHDFIDDDWEDEFDSVEECYIETGRGEAESQILQDIIYQEDPELSMGDFSDIHEMLCESWWISTD